MSFGKAVRYDKKKLDPMNKKIPENPRYSHVRSVLDTGASVSRYLRHVEEIKQNYRFRKDEIFRRLKSTTFAQLILQIELHQDIDDIDTPEPGSPHSGTPPDSVRSTLNSLISGMGEMDIKEQNTVPMLDPRLQLPPPPCPYLLLDVRNRDEYDQAHIISAKHYPPAMLNRSCNFFTQDILDYKNKDGMIIILYDEDERIAPNVAATFIQRDVDNIFMLSGGMKVLHKVFPECMITGQLPPSCRSTPVNSARVSKRASVQPNPPSMSARTGARIPQASSTELQEVFSEDNLDRIQTCLDTALLSGAGLGGSRAASSCSSNMSSPGSSFSSSSAASGRTSKNRGSRSDSRGIATPWK